jgi:hypothetical protein
MATKIKWRTAAFREVRTSQAAADLIERAAERVAEAAGDGYEVRGPQETGGRVRLRAAVVTATADAALDNARNNTLLRALHAGRE